MTEMISYDGVSGTSVLGDGTLVHWTEGRSSWVAVQAPDGAIRAISNAHPATPADRALLERLEQRDAAGYDEYRDMTTAERERWERSRAAVGL